MSTLRTLALAAATLLAPVSVAGATGPVITGVETPTTRIAAGAPQRLTAHPAAASRRAARCGPDHPQIDTLDAAHWRLDRSLVRYHTASPKRINDLAYGQAATIGDHKGWRVWGFRCDSPLFKGGLRNRDVVLSVNGKPTGSIAQILWLWMTQSGRDHFDVEVLRRGQVVTLAYDVQKG